jgi:uncharacterized protein
MPDLLAAFGLFLILEGIMPFLAPGSWKEAFRRVLDMRDGQLRFIGLASIIVGLLIFSIAS